MSRTVPPYPEGRNMLAGKTLVVTAAAGTGIGFWTARRSTTRTLIEPVVGVGLGTIAVAVLVSVFTDDWSGMSAKDILGGIAFTGFFAWIGATLGER